MERKGFAVTVTMLMFTTILFGMVGCGSSVAASSTGSSASVSSESSSSAGSAESSVAESASVLPVVPETPKFETDPRKISGSYNAVSATFVIDNKVVKAKPVDTTDNNGFRKRWVDVETGKYIFDKYAIEQEYMTMYAFLGNGQFTTDDSYRIELVKGNRWKDIHHANKFDEYASTDYEAYRILSMKTGYGYLEVNNLGQLVLTGMPGRSWAKWNLDQSKDLDGFILVYINDASVTAGQFVVLEEVVYEKSKPPQLY